jgi:hypothetical protein
MRTWSRRRRIVGLCALLLVVGAFGLLFAGDDRGARTRSSPRTDRSKNAPGPGASAELPAASASAVPWMDVRYAFDEGFTEQIGDARLPLHVKVAEGGSLGATRHGAGRAVRFPRPCAEYGAERCSRAVLQSGPALFLNPDRAPFRFGASILLAPDETSKGANVVQKGFSVGDSQFKLQVDGLAGMPSCVVVGNGSPVIYLAQASVSVSDGVWHQVECRRGDAVLTIVVDGSTVGQKAIPPSLSIVNSDPLSIGGKGTTANNDQFTGSIDDVFVTRDA